MAQEDLLNGRDYKINTHTNESRCKIAKNSLSIFPWDFLALKNWFIDIALPSDIIEGVSLQVGMYPSTNQTKEKEKVLYRPAFILHTYKCDVKDGTIVDADIGKYFNLKPWVGQYIDYATKNSTGGQFRLETKLWARRGEFRLVVNLGNNLGLQWPTGATGLTGATWPDWPQWPKGLKGDAGDMPQHDRQWTTLSFENPDWSYGLYVDLQWPLWPKGNQGDMWPAWPQWIPWLSFTWMWPYNGATVYSVRDVTQFQWSTYMSVVNSNVGAVPWISSNWELVALKGVQWPSWPSWPPWPSGWPMWPMPDHNRVWTSLQFEEPWGWYGTLVNLLWPAWPAWPAGIQWQDWADGVQWPVWPAWPNINEFINMRKSWPQSKSFSGDWSDEFVVTWQNVYTGNNGMVQAWTNKNYIIATSDMSAEISCALRWAVTVSGVPTDTELVRTTVRMFMFVTDSSNAIKYSHFWFLDTKDSSIEPANYNGVPVPKEGSLSGTAIIPLNSGDRVWCLFRFSNDINPSWGTVTWVVEWPVGIPSSPSLWTNAWSSFTVRKIFNKI